MYLEIPVSKSRHGDVLLRLRKIYGVSQYFQDNSSNRLWPLPATFFTIRYSITNSIRWRYIFSQLLQVSLASCSPPVTIPNVCSYVQKPHMLPAQGVCVFRVIIVLNTEHFPEHE